MSNRNVPILYKYNKNDLPSERFQTLPTAIGSSDISISTEINHDHDNNKRNSMKKKDKSNSTTIDKKINKLIWIMIGIFILFILSIILFWSLVFTCIYCVEVYNYMYYLHGNGDNHIGEGNVLHDIHKEIGAPCNLFE
jgi:hypothetical protein